MKVLRKTTELEKNVFSFLNGLRETSVTNMFGAVPYIRQAFPDMPKFAAKKLLLLWFEVYNEEGNYDEIMDEE